jgi:predicted metal-dependent enzyme (double-stranded beta helix superfamily)
MIEGLGARLGRPLDGPELVRLVERVAERRELWTPHVDPAATERTYAALHRDASVDVWAIFWLPDNDTGWHDHDTSSGAVHVVEGALREHALLVMRPERSRRHAAGSSFAFGPSHIHRLTCAEAFAVSIHAYSPPLWRLGQYAVDAGGALHRTSVSYADELRPLGPPPLEVAA